MSLVKTGAVQVGQSATASNNFHWRNLLDGVFRLTRGNAGAPITDVMLVNADNSVAFPSGVSSGVLGTGQTWQDVKAGRAPNTTYTNSTGRPIMVVCSSIMTSTASEFVVDGVSVAKQQGFGGGDWVYSFVVVPVGATYRLNGANAIFTWAELR